jgi:hypothetical protein
MEPKNKPTEEIQNLCRKAEQTRSIHSMMKDRIVLINRIFLLYVTIGSAITAMLIFAPISTTHPILIGIFSATIFIASIIPSTLGFDLKILERTMAVQTWGEWIRDAKSFCNTDISKMDAENTNLKYGELLIAYKKAMDNTPLIPDSKFNKYKRLHLQKVAISKALDKTPFKKIKDIKKELFRLN